MIERMIIIKFKNRIIQLFLSVALAVTAIPMNGNVYADVTNSVESTSTDVDQTDYFTYTISGSTCKVAGLTTLGEQHHLEDLVIPSTAYGYTVTGIDDYAFKGVYLGSLTMPTTSRFQYIGKGAFQSCHMDTLYIPKNVTSLGSEALKYFYGTTIIFGGGIRTIPSLNMWSCSNLTDIYFADGTVVISDDVCGYCPVERIYIGSTVSNIGSSSFHYATSNGSGNDALRNVTIYTDNAYAKGLTYRLSYINPTFKSASEYVADSATAQSKTFRKDSPSDITFSVPNGTVKQVNVSGLSISFKCSAGILTVYASDLSMLPNGIYDIQVVYDDAAKTTLSNKCTVLVTGTEQSGSNNNKDNPEAVDIKTYRFFKDHQRDVMIPIKMNGASTLSSIYIDDVQIDQSNYSFTNDTILISSDYLNSIDVGVHRILPKFDGDRFINNLVLEVYAKYDDRLLPYLLTSFIKYNKADVHMTVDLGIGDTKATDVKMLIIDNTYVTPSGNTYDYNPSVSPSAITSPSAIATQALTDRAFRLDGTDLVLSSKFVDNQNWAAGTDHTIGCIFDNCEETASLKRVTLSIPSTQSSNDNNGNNNSNGNTSGGGTSGGGSSASGNTAGDGNTTGGSTDEDTSGGNTTGDGSSAGGNTAGGGTPGSGGTPAGGGTTGGSTGGDNADGNTSGDDSDNGSKGVTTLDPITRSDDDFSSIVIPLPKDDPLTDLVVNVNNKDLVDKDYTVNKDNNLSFTDSGRDKFISGVNSIRIMTHKHTYQQFITITSSQHTVCLHDKTYKGGKLQYKLPNYDNTYVLLRINGKLVDKNQYTVSKSGVVRFKNGTIKRFSDGANGITFSTANKDYVTFVNVTRAKVELFIPYILCKQTMSVGQRYVIPLSGAKSVTYKSSNKKIATVDATGLVTAKKAGKCYVTVLAKDKSGKLYKAKFHVTVKATKSHTVLTAPPTATKVTVLNLNAKCKVGKTIKLTLKNAGTKIIYTSSNKKVAKVNKKGIIRGTKSGNTVVTATIRKNNTTYIYKYTVTVK